MKLQTIYFIAISALACKSTDAQLPYTLNHPDQRYELPSILNEVSGVTDLDNEHLAMVQDEIGLIFVYNLATGMVSQQLPFDTTGDFEGLTYTGESLFVLRSDGRLTEWKNFTHRDTAGAISHHMLALETRDNEGLGYDKSNHRLLIAAKSKPGNPEEKEERFIYSYDLATQALTIESKYSLNTDELAAKAKTFGIATFTLSSKGKPKPFNFRPSSIALHPLTNQVYILSAADHLLVVLSDDGEVDHMQTLSDKLFPKAEGITFLADGTMLISNEADGKVANILRFNPR